MSQQDPIWTEARVALLSRMWSEGSSSGAISKALGVVTRNAVMGKVNRLGLMGAQGTPPAAKISVTRPVLAVLAAGTAPAPAVEARSEPVRARKPSRRRVPAPKVPPDPEVIAAARQAARAANLALLQGYASLSGPVARGPVVPSTSAPSDAVVVGLPEPAATPDPPAAPVPPAPAVDHARIAREAEALRRANEEISAARLVAITAAGERRRERAEAAAAERALKKEEREMDAPSEDDALGWMPPAAPGEPVTVMRLRSHMCRWPFGDPAKPGFHFCGVDAIEGKPYCVEHAMVAYQAPAPRSSRQSAGWTPERIFKARQIAVARMQNKRPGRRSQKFATVAAE